MRYCTIYGVKTKVLISFTVTVKLICVFVFRICRLLVFPCSVSIIFMFNIPQTESGHMEMGAWFKVLFKGLKKPGIELSTRAKMVLLHHGDFFII